MLPNIEVCLRSVNKSCIAESVRGAQLAQPAIAEHCGTLRSFLLPRFLGRAFLQPRVMLLHKACSGQCPKVGSLAPQNFPTWP